MIRSIHRLAFRPLRNERGVALPLALLGLISVSLLVTTALVTSSTELAISSAHRDATQALYVAEGGLQTYVATRGPNLMADTGATFAYTPPSGTASERVDITVTYLGEQPISGGRRLRVFTVDATPVQGGGRRVATMVKQIVPPPSRLSTNVKSAITLGGNLNVNGNAFTVTGRSSTCNSQGVQAVRHASNSTVVVNNDGHWNNFVGVDSLGNQTTGQAAVRNSGLSKQALAREALGLPEGQTLNDLIARIPASKKWGPRYSPAGGPVRVFDGTVDPGELVAVVDANRGTVDVRGGSGLLIIVNGNLEMTGNTGFQGVIIVEGNFRLAGTPTITGALISLGDDSLNEIQLDPSAIANGHITVAYDKCQIDVAEDGFGRATQDSLTPTVSGTFAWQELVR